LHPTTTFHKPFGQANCSQVRLNAVNELTGWLATDPTGTGDPDLLLLGDLNSYAVEDPVTALTSAGCTNLVKPDLGDGWAERPVRAHRPTAGHRHRDGPGDPMRRARQQRMRRASR
jgi:hypothetical protein